MNGTVGSLGYLPFAMALQSPLLTLFTLGSAVLLARLGRRWTVSGARTRLLLLAVTVPGFAVGILFNSLVGHMEKVALHAPAYAVFFAGLAVVFVPVGRLARAGRTRAAWWTGILGAVLLADIAVMLPLLRLTLPAEESLHAGYAPVWLFTALTDSGFGLPHPTAAEVFTIGDVAELDPFLFIAFTGLALGAVITPARRRRSALEAAGRLEDGERVGGDPGVGTPGAGAAPVDGVG